MQNYTVSDLETQVSAEEYAASCVDVEKFLGYCRECPNFGKKWACPPLTEDPMEIWHGYRTLKLYARVLTPGAGMTMEELMEVFRDEKIRLSRQVLELEEQFPGSRSMAAGTCLACETCTRIEGKTCRYPEQVRFSLEALGADVGLTMEKYLHKPLQWSSQGQLPAYLTLVAGLLLK